MPRTCGGVCTPDCAWWRSSQISTFLANKSCRDCVAFYYDTKKLTDYKVLLREQTNALRRRMTRTSWPLTLQAAASIGYGMSHWCHARAGVWSG